MLTPLQRRKLTRYFRVYDLDHDGRVGPRDFDRIVGNVRALRESADGASLDADVEESYARRWEALRASADTDHDGTVDLEEWLAYWDGVLEDDARYDDEVARLVSRLFEVFDTDGDGVLGPDEFCDFYGVFDMGAALARKMFVDLDADSDGTITRDELVLIAHEFFRGDTEDAPGNFLFGPY